MNTPWKILLAIGVVWIVVGGTIMWSRSAKPTVESVTAMIARSPMADLDPRAREKLIGRVADQINALDFEQREKLRKERIDRSFFEQLTEAERQRFLDLTLPEGFRQLMLSLNKMTPEKRQKLVDRALNDIKDGNPEMADPVDRVAAEKFVAQGMEAFYSEASAEVKLDFAPVIERLQQASKGFR